MRLPAKFLSKSGESESAKAGRLRAGEGLARVCEVKRTPDFKRTLGGNQRDRRGLRDQSDGKVRAQALV